jgi:hypothetical protein
MTANTKTHCSTVHVQQTTSTASANAQVYKYTRIQVYDNKKGHCVDFRFNQITGNSATPCDGCLSLLNAVRGGGNLGSAAASCPRTSSTNIAVVRGGRSAAAADLPPPPPLPLPPVQSSPPFLPPSDASIASTVSDPPLPAPPLPAPPLLAPPEPLPLPPPLLPDPKEEDTPPPPPLPSPLPARLSFAPAWFAARPALSSPQCSDSLPERDSTVVWFSYSSAGSMARTHRGFEALHGWLPSVPKRPSRLPLLPPSPGRTSSPSTPHPLLPLPLLLLLLLLLLELPDPLALLLLLALLLALPLLALLPAHGPSLPLPLPLPGYVVGWDAVTPASKSRRFCSRRFTASGQHVSALATLQASTISPPDGPHASATSAGGHILVMAPPQQHPPHLAPRAALDSEGSPPVSTVSSTGEAGAIAEVRVTRKTTGKRKRRRRGGRFRGGGGSGGGAISAGAPGIGDG